jgi:hypothetical protein
MLNFSENCRETIHFIDGLDNFGTVLGEIIPVDKGLITNHLEDSIKVLFDCFDFDFRHVEN